MYYWDTHLVIRLGVSGGGARGAQGALQRFLRLAHALWPQDTEATAPERLCVEGLRGSFSGGFQAAFL